MKILTTTAALLFLITSCTKDVSTQLDLTSGLITSPNYPDLPALRANTKIYTLVSIAIDSQNRIGGRFFTKYIEFQQIKGDIGKEIFVNKCNPDSVKEVNSVLAKGYVRISPSPTGAVISDCK